MKARRAILALLAAGCLAAAPSSGAERRPAPREPGLRAGTWAIGAALGFSNATGDDDFDAEPVLGGYFEYFTTNHASLRGQIGFVNFDGPPAISGPGDVDVVAVTGDALYHWDAGRVHPFVAGGVGIYNYDPQFGGGDNELGLNGGGGLDIFVTRDIAIEFQALLHETTEDRGPDSFVNATGAVRFEF